MFEQLIPSVPLGYPINIFGKSMAGKTLLTLQTSIQYCSKINKNVCILDVDGGANIFVNNIWKPVFQQIYSFKGDVIIVPSWNIKTVAPQQQYVKFEMKIFELFGVKARAEISKQGKTEFTPYAISDERIEKMIEQQNVGAIIVDSFSQIFKDCFIGTQSFAERARAEDMLFSLLKTVGYKHSDLLIFLNHHQTANPITGHIEIAGGGAVIQNSKVAFYVEQLKGKKSNYGRIWVYRYPNIPPWSKYVYIKYSDAGISIPTNEELKEIE